jgi:hypothetical protein
MLDGVRRCERALDNGRGVESSAANRRDSEAAVCCARSSSESPVGATSGSSGSFSMVTSGGLLLDATIGSDEEDSLGLEGARRTPAFARAAKVLVVLEVGAALREARAVLAEMDEVGGLETRMDRIGDSKVACVGG